MVGRSATRCGWVLSVLGAAGLSLAACSDDGTPAADGTTTTTPTASCASGRDTAPIVLDSAAGVATVTDVVVRPSGQVVAIGTSIWVREPDASTWQATTTPGGPDLRPTAVLEVDGEVWLATNDGTGQQQPSRVFRSSDLATWVEVPFRLDGEPAAVAINAARRDDSRWLALAQDAEAIHLISSPDGQDWTTEGSVTLQNEAGPGRALFDLGVVDGEPTSVGFTVGDALKPLVIRWPGDGGSVDEEVFEDAALDGVRLWGLAPLGDGRVLVAADRVARTPANEPTGFTPLLYELDASGQLVHPTTLPATSPFALPAGLAVVSDDEAVVVGSMGDTRRTLVPAAWVVCLP